MYRVAICEDEAPVRESLHRMCGELLAELDVPNEITTFSRAEALKTDLRLHHQPESVTIRTGAGVTVLPLDRLWYVESRDHVLVAQLEQGELVLRMRLSDMEVVLPGDWFCRCHNSYLVNMRRIVRLDRMGLLLENGAWIPIGRNYYKAAQEKLVRFLNES